MVKKASKNTGARKAAKRTSRSGSLKMGLMSAFAVDKRSPKTSKAGISVTKVEKTAARRGLSGTFEGVPFRTVQEPAEVSQFRTFTNKLTEKFTRGTDEAKERALEIDGYATIEDGEVIIRRK